MGAVGELGHSRVYRDNKVWVEVLNQEELMKIIEMKRIMNGQTKIKVGPALNVGTRLIYIYIKYLQVLFLFSLNHLSVTQEYHKLSILIFFNKYFSHLQY